MMLHCYIALQTKAVNVVKLTAKETIEDRILGVCKVNPYERVEQTLTPCSLFYGHAMERLNCDRF